MALILPAANNTLGGGSHSLLHRVVAVDGSAPEQSIKVYSSGKVDLVLNNANTSPNANNIPIADANKTVDSWVTRTLICPVTAVDGSVTSGDGKLYFPVPAEINGFNLIETILTLATASTSGLPTYQIRRYRSSANADMLSTKVSCDINELTSATANTASVIDTSYDDVNTGDFIYFDKDVAGTGELGDTITLRFRKP